MGGRRWVSLLSVTRSSSRPAARLASTGSTPRACARSSRSLERTVLRPRPATSTSGMSRSSGRRDGPMRTSPQPRVCSKAAVMGPSIPAWSMRPSATVRRSSCSGSAGPAPEGTTRRPPRHVLRGSSHAFGADLRHRLDPARLTGVPDAVEAIGLCGLALGPALFIVQCGVLLEARELVGLFRTAGAALGTTGVPIGGPDLSLGDEASFLVEGAGVDFSGRETHPSGDQLTLIAQNGLGMSQELGETTGDDPQSRIALDLPGAGVSPGSCVVCSAAQTQQSAQCAVGVSEPETTGQSHAALS